MAIITLQGEAEKKLGIYYQVDSSQEPIGSGGMGQVFKGLQVNQRTGATREVAVKVMYSDLPPSTIERARREASIRLRNDNLIEMLAFIETTEQDTFGGQSRKHYHVVSELLEGIALSDLMDGKTTDRTGVEMPIAVKMLQDYRNDPEHFAVIIITNILSGLLALHDAGYIHRDIDPSNIMLTKDGKVKLIDFGIAKQMNDLTTSDKGLTVAGSFMGKPEYAAPELANGDIKHQNQTTDIYATGILLYQCIIGHPPFEGPRHEVLDKQLHAKIPLAPVKNKALRQIISIACEKKQELRYQSAAQMRVALETMAGSGRKMSPKKRLTIIAAAVVFVLLLAGVGIVVVSKQKAAKERAIEAQFEQQKTEFVAQLNARLDEADRTAAAGFAEAEDFNETALMQAYDQYAALESFAEGAAQFAVDMPDVSAKQSDILTQLNTICASMQEQAAGLEELGEKDMAAAYIARVETVQQFLAEAGFAVTQATPSETPAE